MTMIDHALGVMVLGAIFAGASFASSTRKKRDQRLALSLGMVLGGGMVALAIVTRLGEVG